MPKEGSASEHDRFPILVACLAYIQSGGRQTGYLPCFTDLNETWKLGNSLIAMFTQVPKRRLGTSRQIQVTYR
jgi:hypothetical protein